MCVWPLLMPIHICDRGLSDYHSLSPEPRSPEPGVGSIAPAAAVEAMMMMIHHLAFTFPLLITLSGGLGAKHVFLSWLSQVGKRLGEGLPSCFSWFPRFKLNPWHARLQRWSVPPTMQEISQVIECRAGLVNWEVITRRWFYFKCYLGQCLRLPIIIPTGEMLFFNGTYETIG